MSTQQKERVFGNLVKISQGLGFLNENNLVNDYRDWALWTPINVDNVQQGMALAHPHVHVPQEEATYTINSHTCYYKKIGNWVKLLINVTIYIETGGSVVVMGGLPTTANKGSNNGNLVNAITVGDPLGYAQATLVTRAPFENENNLVFEGNFVTSDSVNLIGEFIYQSDNLSQY